MLIPIVLYVLHNVLYLKTDALFRCFFSDLIIFQVSGVGKDSTQ